jgi:hypothetical protein
VTDEAERLRARIEAAAATLYGLLVDGTLEMHQFDALLRILGADGEKAKADWEQFDLDEEKE